MSRKVLVFTANRAEYGLLRPVVKALSTNPDFEVLLVVSGGHLSHRFGMTVSEIENDGFPIYRRISILEDSDRALENGLVMARLAAPIAETIAQARPDFLMILGDRFELLPVVSAALIQNVPVVHLCGGETTEGAVDNQVRHAISKMAHVHFPSMSEGRDNLLKMGEEAWRICVAGDPGLDDVLKSAGKTKGEIFGDLGLPMDRDVAAVTFHPETLDNQITPSLVVSILERMLTDKRLFCLATASNFDNGGVEINDALQALAQRRPQDFKFIASLGKSRYYAFLRHASVMVGNSSSGLLEAQSFLVPVVNVGKRQRGRIANPNVVNVEGEPEAVAEAVLRASSVEFRKSFRDKPNIYGDGKAASRIEAFLKNAPYERLLMKKDQFHH